jgi:hypothetical protein
MRGLFKDVNRASLLLKGVCGGLLAGGATVAITSANAQLLPADAQATCTVTAPVFSGWFASGSPTPNGVVNPANSVTFINTANNCIFYRWSEQMFLWAMSPAPPSYGGGGGRIFDSPAFYDVSPPDAGGERTLIPHTPGFLHIMGVRAAQVGPHGLPLVLLASGKLAEVEEAPTGPTGRPELLNSAGRAVEVDKVVVSPALKATFLDTAGKPIAAAKPQIRTLMRPLALTAAARPVPPADSAVLEKLTIQGKPILVNSLGQVVKPEQGQADGAVLMSEKGSLIYYAITVNDVYAYFLTGTMDGGITPKPTQFPTTAGNLSKITTFASAHGKTFPDPDALAIELKTSWVEASSVPDVSKYITMMASIPVYDKSDPKHWKPTGANTTVLLAMVGAHVVGSVNGHPELVWATFEHFGNVPNGAYQYNGTSGTNPKTVPQGGTSPWLFAKNTTGPFNTALMNFDTPPDIVGNPISSSSTTLHDIGPSDTIEWKIFGGGFDFKPNPLDASTAASNTEVISVNKSVIGQLSAGDIRANYFMAGATWTIGGAAPSTPFKSGVGDEVGTSQLTNSTMETYQQGSDHNWFAQGNCFLCHRNNTTGVSHIFDVTKPLF